jgi:hypothetical protein
MTIDEIKTKFPQFNIVKKSDSTLMKIINILLMIITLGQMRAFMTHYITTLSFTVYVPDSWDTMSDISKEIILSHEAKHMEQRTNAGMLVFSFLYLLALPAVFTMRSVYEKEAYEVSIRLTYQYCQNLDYMKGEYKEFIVSQFTGASYMWMNPFKSSVEKWYDSVIETLK